MFAGSLKVEPGSVVVVAAGRVVDGDNVVVTVVGASVVVAVAADVLADCDTTSPLSSSPRLRRKAITPMRSTAITAAPMTIGRRSLGGAVSGSGRVIGTGTGLDHVRSGSCHD